MEDIHREKLAPYVGQDVKCFAYISRFAEGETGNPICLLKGVYINREFITHHLWLGQNIAPKLFKKFQVGQTITFYGEVYRYDRRAYKDDWAYGIRYANHFRHKTMGEYMHESGISQAVLQRRLLWKWRIKSVPTEHVT